MVVDIISQCSQMSGLLNEIKIRSQAFYTMLDHGYANAIDMYLVAVLHISSEVCNEPREAPAKSCILPAQQILEDALSRLALIVRGADTNKHNLAPEAAGLLAMSLNLSRMCRDDLIQLDLGMTLYDAFYRWARDATKEGHDWPAAVDKA